MDFILIEILNWSKYNPRGDVKSPSWFRFENRLIESPDFYSWPGEHIKALLYILSQASKKNSAHVRIYAEHALRVALIKAKDLHATIEKLQELQVIQVTSRARDGDVTCTSRARDGDVSLRTDGTERNETDETQVLRTFDFEKVYMAYPRKEGKKRGLEICKRVIKTGQDYEKLFGAIRRYCIYLKTQGTEPQYVKHFDTFMNSWTDWTDQNAGKVLLHASSPPPAPKPPEEDFIASQPDPESLALIKKAMGGFIRTMPR